MTEKEKVLKYLIEHLGGCQSVSCLGKMSSHENTFNFEVCHMRFYCKSNHKAVSTQMKEREILAKEQLEEIKKLKFLEELQ